MRGNQPPRPPGVAGAQFASNPRPDHFQGLARQLTPPAFGRADLRGPRSRAVVHPPISITAVRPGVPPAPSRFGRGGGGVAPMTGASAWSRLRAVLFGRPRDL